MKRHLYKRRSSFLVDLCREGICALKSRDELQRQNWWNPSFPPLLYFSSIDWMLPFLSRFISPLLPRLCFVVFKSNVSVQVSFACSALCCAGRALFPAQAAFAVSRVPRLNRFSPSTGPSEFLIDEAKTSTLNKPTASRGFPLQFSHFSGQGTGACVPSWAPVPSQCPCPRCRGKLGHCCRGDVASLASAGER